jgi:hypothetical protein
MEELTRGARLDNSSYTTRRDTTVCGLTGDAATGPSSGCHRDFEIASVEPRCGCHGAHEPRRQTHTFKLTPGCEEAGQSSAEIDEAFRPQVLDLFGDQELSDYAPSGPLE